jgi:CRISPR/Cas system CSM-associated protein Csm3 (group 7 of RAMP superfamily)
MIVNDIPTVPGSTLKGKNRWLRGMNWGLKGNAGLKLLLVEGVYNKKAWVTLTIVRFVGKYRYFAIELFYCRKYSAYCLVAYQE